MIYELRIYSCLPGRLPALLKRFETNTLKIWENHGIKQAGFWTVLIGDGRHGEALNAKDEAGSVRRSVLNAGDDQMSDHAHAIGEAINPFHFGSTDFLPFS